MIMNSPPPNQFKKALNNAVIILADTNRPRHRYAVTFKRLIKKPNQVCTMLKFVCRPSTSVLEKTKRNAQLKSSNNVFRLVSPDVFASKNCVDTVKLKTFLIALRNHTI
jgi:predicted ester cyclase